ncbi:MAG: DUF3667 domain-containing protein [Bacteroidota bacterium]
MSSNTSCLNCEQPLTGEARFCDNCGQKSDTHRLNLHHLGHELMHFFTHADKGIFFLVKTLITKPGYAARQYISGQRKKIFSPINFFLISVAFFLFVQTNFRPLDRGLDLSGVKEQVLKLPDRVTRERRLLKLERREKGAAFVAKYSNFINFTITPLIAWLFFMFYRRSGFNYTEHLVANLYLAGFSALFFGLIIAPLLYFNKQTTWYFAIVGLFFSFEVIYRSVYYYNFIQKKGAKSYLYSLFTSLFTVILWYIISSSLMLLYINTGFGSK